VRVPLIIRWPRVAAPGQTCSTRVVTHDLFATIVEAAKLHDSLDVPSIDGLSLVPLLRDTASQLARTALFWHFPHYYPTTSPVSAVLDGRHKLLHYYEEDRLELYDLTTGPAESIDLAAKEPETAVRLRLRLDNWLEEVGAGMPRIKN
jgi:arylsulfatase A-like enzyme